MPILYKAAITMPNLYQANHLVEYSCSSFSYIPQWLRQVHIILVRVLESRYFFPQRVDLFTAIIPYRVQIRGFINASALVEYLHHKLPGAEVGDRLSLPCMFRIEYLIWLVVIDDFIMKCDHICQRLAALPVIKPPDLLESRSGDFLNILAHLYLRDYNAVFLNSAKFVNTAEDGSDLDVISLSPTPKESSKRPG